MTEKYVFAEHLNGLNDIIKQPLQITQRIKFTCFDVSQKYIIFGATSGGLYVYQRFPCAFIKLIPNKEGSIANISISPDEKSTVLSTTKGLLIIIENCFSESELIYHQFNEHEYASITAIKWQNSDIYCGDNFGKVSVLSLPNILGKAIFQTPCTALMTLDSSIIQIDVWRKHLLVSTTTRTYLCDTEKEHYKQIGKKLRDGPFGACFIADKNETYAPARLSVKNFFHLNREALVDDRRDVTSEAKIFCTRPGVRLWEADFECTVVCTHQFKNSLIQAPIDVICLGDRVDSRFKIVGFENGDYNLPESFNFGRIYFFAGKFLLSFSRDCIYVFETQTVSLIFWSNYVGNICDLRIFGDFVYVWCDNGDLRVFSVGSLEDLIMESLFKKQYLLCADLILQFNDYLQSLIKTSNKIHLISILKEKLCSTQHKEILESLKPTLNKIKEFSDKKTLGQKLKSGIYVVDNAHFIENQLNQQKPDDEQQIETFLKGISTTVTDKLTEGTRSIREKFETTIKILTEKKNENDKNGNNNKDIKPESTEAQDNSATEIDPISDINYNLNVLYRQYEMNKINKNLIAPNFINLMESKSDGAVLELIEEFVVYMKQEETAVKDWCYSQFLNRMEKRVENLLSLDCKIVEYCKEGFFNLNKDCINYKCDCKFPLPSAKDKTPIFCNVGCQLIKLKNSLEITTEVPFMWKYFIKDDRKFEEKLNLIVQYSDEELFKYFIEDFTYDNWYEAIRLFLRLKQNYCLNCENKIDNNGAMNWSTFSTLMLESIGVNSTLKLLKRYSEHIPNGELDHNFYQTCILASTVDNYENKLRKDAIKLISDSGSDFEGFMGDYLLRKYQRNSSYEETGVNYVDGAKCSHCSLPVRIKMLGNPEKPNCGHVYHKLCLNRLKNVCSLCKLQCDG